MQTLASAQKGRTHLHIDAHFINFGHALLDEVRDVGVRLLYVRREVHPERGHAASQRRLLVTPALPVQRLQALLVARQPTLKVKKSYCHVDIDAGGVIGVAK